MQKVWGISLKVLGPYKLNSIVTGDSKELAEAIPDESVDLIFTDPMYQNIDDYRWLAKIATRVLKPNTPLLVFCGNAYKFDVMQALSDGGLTYRWDFANNWVGSGATYWHGKIGVKWCPLLWFDKGHFVPYRGIPDSAAFSRGGRKYWVKTNFKWGKSVDVLEWKINAFSHAMDIVVDFFCGEGVVPAACKMLGRNYVAFEILSDVAERARQRVINTQSPLFVMQPKQLEMGVS